MLKNTLSLLLKILIIAVCFTLMFAPTVHAEDGIWTSIFEDGKNFLNAGSGSTLNNTELKDTSSTIFNVLFTIGIILIVIVGAVLGIQFMISSTESKAKIKESFIPYVAGSIVIIGAFSIWKICISIFSQI